jgi:hypothetical protein
MSTRGFRERMRAFAAISLAGSLAACLPVEQNRAHYSLISARPLRPHGVAVDVGRYQARSSVHVSSLRGFNGHTYAVAEDSEFSEGSIDIEVAATPRAGAGENARGFIGVAFHLQPGGQFECFYLRMSNGRADDQLRRNHSTQYIAEPEYPWPRLRGESPGKYESYVDLAVGEWTAVHIEVHRGHAALYVNHARYPTLTIDELGATAHEVGKLALWVGDDTEGYFRNLTVSHASSDPLAASRSLPPGAPVSPPARVEN